MQEPPVIAIRGAVVDDARAIADVHIQSYRSTYVGIFPKAFLDSLSVDTRGSQWLDLLAAAAPPSLTLVASDDNGRIVGFLSGGRERTGQLERDGEICALYLLPEAQRQGVGTQLVQRFARVMQAQGLASMAVWVLARNPSRKFYESLGGQLIGEQEIERGGESFTEVAYGWRDLSLLGA